MMYSGFGFDSLEVEGLADTASGDDIIEMTLNTRDKFTNFRPDTFPTSLFDETSETNRF